ncbi:MAG: VOC family protein [Acetobacteraceae bacterium]|nr:VOC family protein [Acetobacteraceae bacterium]MCX7684858.1 VOC family protein [Acetobacteraceae bacterium]MDW8397546.1 VOC family protein [Acetobacteraceae bacterium]
MTDPPAAPAPAAAITWLYSDDLAAHAAFYREVMGLSPVLEQRSEAGGCVLFRVAEGAFLGLCDLRHRPRGTAGVLVTLVVPELAAAMAGLAARGAAFEGGVVEGPGHRSAFLRDPAGYLLELQEFADPRFAAACRPAPDPA